MTKSVKEIFCPGCHRTGMSSDSRHYCPECREDLKKQACVLCSAPVLTDVPQVLCDACEEDCRLNEESRDLADL
jgi:hypothetical protein